jgi:predicted phosphohydrolase
MKIQYVSDLHLELLFKNTIKLFNHHFVPQGDICILAGDIGNPFHKSYTDHLYMINSQFKKTFLIAGNHEYYNNDIDETKQKITSICEKLENVSFLDNSFEDYNGYRFIGSTLWTNIINKQYTINDTKMIRNMSVDKYNLLHQECCNFLNETLHNCTINDIKSVIITHHLPIYELTHPKYRNSFYANYQQWFHANLDTMIKNNSKIISAVIYGHTHSESIQQHYGVNFYCNPLGYHGENNVSDVNKVFFI